MFQYSQCHLVTIYFCSNWNNFMAPKYKTSDFLRDLRLVIRQVLLYKANYKLHWDTMSNLRFSALLKDSSTCGQKKPGVEPLTL